MAGKVGRPSKTYIKVAPASLWGDFDETTMNDPSASHFDLPGYSDKRREAELARSRNEAPAPLKHRFHFVRDTKGQSRVAEFKQDKYRPVKWEDAKDLGIDLSRAPGCERRPDGLVGNGDTLLMVINAKDAAANLHRHDEQVRSRAASQVTGDMLDRAEALGTEITEETE